MYVIPTEAPVSSVEDRNGGKAEESALKADLSTRPCGLGRGDKRMLAINDCDNRQ